MPGFFDYIIHDIDEKNNITSKACISGNVYIPESIAVVGYPVLNEFDKSLNDDEPLHDESGHSLLFNGIK